MDTSPKYLTCIFIAENCFLCFFFLDLIILNEALICNAFCLPTNNLTTSLQERCAGADTISLVARILHRSKANLQSMLQNNAAVVEDFYAHLVLFFFVNICLSIQG